MGVCLLEAGKSASSTLNQANPLLSQCSSLATDLYKGLGFDKYGGGGRHTPM